MLLQLLRLLLLLLLLLCAADNAAAADADAAVGWTCSHVLQELLQELLTSPGFVLSMKANSTTCLQHTIT